LNDTPDSWPATFAALTRGQDLSASTAAWAMSEIMSGEATPAQLAAFAVLLRVKGETPDEMSGLVSAMLAHAVPLSIEGPAVDVVGTGGDRAQTVNISTMAALVVGGSGRRVVKHGNRAASSACGTADVLEELGVVIDLSAAGVATTVAEVGIGFCFAPVFHAGMRHAGAPRRELGVPTVFNFLGPLINPGQPPSSAIGCADARMAPVMAQVLADRGHSALVFRGEDGLDELTTTTTSQVWVVNEGSVAERQLDPKRFGIAAAAPEALRGADRRHNAEVVHAVLDGREGPIREVVLLNAAAGIAAYDGTQPDTLDDAIAAGIEQARASIDSGAAARLLGAWVEASQRARS
jgi:anthranilate phosphoribosyltransferase